MKSFGIYYLTETDGTKSDYPNAYHLANYINEKYNFNVSDTSIRQWHKKIKVKKFKTKYNFIENLVYIKTPKTLKPKPPEFDTSRDFIHLNDKGKVILNFS